MPPEHPPARRTWFGNWDHLHQDIRFGVRSLRRDYGFATVAILILALGIGANTTVFSLVNAVLLRPLPFDDPGRLVWIENGKPGSAPESVTNLSGTTSTVGTFEELRKANESFEDITAYFAFFGYSSYKMTGTGEPERLVGVNVVQNFFSLLGVRPQVGRLFTDEECEEGGRPAVLLSHGFWQRRFGGSSGIVGQAITLNDQVVTVVGIMPESFDFSSTFAPGTNVDLYTPLVLDVMRNWGNTLSMVGRLKPGVSIESAQAEADVVIRQIQRAYPDRGTEYGARLSGLKQQVSGSMRGAVLMVWFTVGMVLLIVCANLSSLLLGRGAARKKEIAVRAALGAGRGRLVRQFLTESLLLSGCGAVLGFLLAVAAVRYMTSFQAISIPLIESARIDGPALGFTLVVTILTALFFGAAPALQFSAANLHGELKDSSHGSSAGRRSALVRSALVVSEIALACVLLIGAGLLMRSFLGLLEVDLGFQPEKAVALRLDRGEDVATPAQIDTLAKEVVRRVEAVPGIESAAVTDTLPLDRNRTWGIRVKGQTYPRGQSPHAFTRVVGPGYLRSMGIPLVAGRDFTARDTAGSEFVMLINESMARTLWPGVDPIGQVALSGRTEYRVAGIVRDVRHSSLEEESGMEMYLPISQASPASLELVIRTALPPSTLAASVREALREIDPNLPTTDFRPLESLVNRAVSPRRFIVSLVGGFAALALILAALGIYGVLSYSVAQRRREIGIRMALGAQGREVLGMVMSSGARLAGAGIALGVVAAVALSRVLSSLLFGVSPLDPLAFGGVVLTVAASTLAATYLPRAKGSPGGPSGGIAG